MSGSVRIQTQGQLTPRLDPFHYSSWLSLIIVIQLDFLLLCSTQGWMYFFHSHPHAQLLVWTVCCLLPIWTSWSAPAIATAPCVHISGASSHRNQPQLLLILLKSQHVIAPSLSYDRMCMISLCLCLEKKSLHSDISVWTWHWLNGACCLRT